MGVHPRKLTWHWKIHHLKMYFLLKMWILHCHASFREGTFGFQKRTAVNFQHGSTSTSLAILCGRPSGHKEGVFLTLPEVFQLHLWKLTAGTQKSPVCKGKSSEPNLHYWIPGCKYWVLNCIPKYYSGPRITCLPFTTCNVSISFNINIILCSPVAETEHSTTQTV